MPEQSALLLDLIQLMQVVYRGKGEGERAAMLQLDTWHTWLVFLVLVVYYSI
jgi:hypothetical protein